MKQRNEYIMHDQVRNLVPSLMRQPLLTPCSSRLDLAIETRPHLVSIAVVSSVYLIAMLLSS